MPQNLDEPLGDFEEKILAALIERYRQDKEAGAGRDAGWTTSPQLARMIAADRRTVYFHRDLLFRLVSLRLLESRRYRGRGSHGRAMEFRVIPRNREIHRRLEFVDLKDDYMKTLAREKQLYGEQTRPRLRELVTRITGLDSEEISRIAIVGGASQMLLRPDSYLEDMSEASPALSLLNNAVFARTTAAVWFLHYHRVRPSVQALTKLWSGTDSILFDLGVQRLPSVHESMEITESGWKASAEVVSYLEEVPLAVSVLTGLTWLLHSAPITGTEALTDFGSFPVYVEDILDSCFNIVTEHPEFGADREALERETRECLRTTTLLAFPWDSEW